MGVISKIKKWFRGVDAATEAESPRDGVLSFAGEWHAVEIGFFAGVATGYTARAELAAGFVAVVLGGRRLGSAHLKDARREAGYSGTAFVLGLLVGLGLRALTHRILP